MATARKTSTQAQAAAAEAAPTADYLVKSPVFVAGETYPVDSTVPLTEAEAESLPKGYVELVKPAG